jgi:hypothetical protein
VRFYAVGGRFKTPPVSALPPAVFNSVDPVNIKESFPAKQTLTVDQVKEETRRNDVLFNQVWNAASQGQSLILEVLAELSSTEFKMGKITADGLKKKYDQQLGHFETVRRSALAGAGIPEDVINSLAEIYTFRAKVPSHELEKVVATTKFLPGQYRVTQSSLSDSPTWKLLKAQAPNSLFYSSKFSPEYSAPFQSNTQEGALNIQRFRSITAFAKAIENGLTKEQIDHVRSVLDKARLPAERASKVQEHIRSIKKAFHSHNKHDLEKSILAATHDIKENSLEYKYLINTVAALQGYDVPEDTLPQLPAKRNPEQFIKDFRDAVKTAMHSFPSQAEKLKSLSKNVEAAYANRNKESFPGEHLVAELLSYDLSPALQDELFSVFSTHEGASDTVLNDVLNAHPIAAKLLGDRLETFFTQHFEYTKHYKEGAETLFPHASTNPKFEKHFKNNTHLDSPTPNGAHNSALDEIYVLKLDRLARQFFHYNLDTPLGLSQFEVLANSYDISPGEPSLDRVHGYPPAYHTYEELPIIKYDGYDPFDDMVHHTKQDRDNARSTFLHLTKEKIGQSSSGKFIADLKKLE